MKLDTLSTLDTILYDRILEIMLLFLKQSYDKEACLFYPVFDSKPETFSLKNF